MGNAAGQRAPEIGPGMRVLKIAVVAMGVLIVAGTTVLVVLIARGVSTLGPEHPAVPQAALNEPAGSRIVAMTRVGNRLALAFEGGGEPDRIVVIDPSSGRVLLRIGISH
ncbi:MAG: DUF6476 family protein [Acetobacteraceae bacterium]